MYSSIQVYGEVRISQPPGRTRVAIPASRVAGRGTRSRRCGGQDHVEVTQVPRQVERVPVRKHTGVRCEVGRNPGEGGDNRVLRGSPRSKSPWRRRCSAVWTKRAEKSIPTTFRQWRASSNVARPTAQPRSRARASGRGTRRRGLRRRSGRGRGGRRRARPGHPQGLGAVVEQEVLGDGAVGFVEGGHEGRQKRSTLNVQLPTSNAERPAANGRETEPRGWRVVGAGNAAAIPRPRDGPSWEAAVS